MRGSIFRKRALEEGLRYGKDRWVFLRELAQNARDAGATRIKVRTGLEDGEVMVLFEDDGAGMPYEHARDYLFRLYASSKESDRTNAGQFGVGFWSVLLFEPSTILIESRPLRGAPWAVALDGDLNEVSNEPCGLEGHGTRILLRRPTRDSSDPAQVAHAVRAALSQYCRHLKRNNRAASPLPVEVDGSVVTESLTTAGTVQMRFRDRNVEGAVGLGDKPRVELYSRGLLVWRGTLLDELRFGAREGDGRQYPPGLAPVYVLNGHRLNVTLDRRAVIDDRRLTEVRVVARRAMRNLLQGYLDKFSPRTPWQRLRDGLVGLWEDAGESGRRPWLVLSVTAILLLIAVVLVMPSLVPRPGSAELPPVGESGGAAQLDTPLVWPQSFAGVGVEPERASAKLQLAYQPAYESHYFRVASFEQLDPGAGVEARPLAPVGHALGLACEPRCLDVAVRIEAGPGLLPLPMPTGYSVDPTSVRLGGQPMGPVLVTRYGDPLLDLREPGRGVLTFRAGPSVSPPLSEDDRALLLALPADMPLPDSLASLAARAKVGWSPAPRARWLTSRVQSMVAYDASPQVAQRYSLFLSAKPKTGWLDFVLRLGRGDCDVKNTVLVAALRSALVPARLALGFVGEEGQAQPGLHAWVESYPNGWLPLDASGSPETKVEPEVLAPAAPGEGRSDPPASDPTTALSEPTVPTAVTPPAATQQELAQPDAGPNASKHRFTLLRIIAFTFGCLSLILAALAFGLAFLSRERWSIETVLGAGSSEEIAARLLESAVFRPDLWADASDLARRELLPVRGRALRMTLNEALRRRNRGVLWRAEEDSSLSKQAQGKGRKILDASHEVFGEVVRRLPGCQNLDELSRLEPLAAKRCPDALRAAHQLVARANAFLEEAGVKEGLLRLCPTGALAPIRDVDLRRLGLPARSGQPQVYVAVLADRPPIEQLARLFDKEPELAAFALLELALVESAMLRPMRSFLRLRAATSLAKRHGAAP